MSLTARDTEERALAMAMVIMGANTAGIYGVQIFRPDDKPKYRRGFSIAIAILAFGPVLAVLRYLDSLRQRRKAKKQSKLIETEHASTTSSSDASIASDEKKI